MERAGAIRTGDARRVDLDLSPITPEHVLEGEPIARSTQLTASDCGAVTTYVWDCTAGRFHWYFGVDEVVHILDGEVHVTDDDGTQHVLRAGDVGHFPLGSHSIWHVPEYVRKFAVHRAPARRPLVRRAAGRVRRLALGLNALALPAIELLPV
ncbi:cupin domain-containing protein [Baekduia sp. Peel2402]|uniref:cupin domain-containing protein n=1 Tax=Baekduia sp. Peel2402 TaxID=3458296 RepID=UPI00403EA50A